MIWKIRKYIGFVSASLPGFKLLSNNPYLSTFRCIYCGDSKRKLSKKRAYLIQDRNDIYYYCHNCLVNKGFVYLLKEKFPSIYDEYRFEDFKKEKKESECDVNKFKTRCVFKKEIDYGMSISQCAEDHYGRLYVEKRKIPETFHHDLYVSTVSNIASQFTHYRHLAKMNHRVLVIPFFQKDLLTSYISLRTLDKDAPFRYLTLEIVETGIKLWGIKYVDWSMPVYVFEGPIDAMMVPNGIAMASAGNSQAIKYIKENAKSSVVFVYDNEIRKNSQIRMQVQKRIDEGFSVFIPEKKFPYKDANEAIMNDFPIYDYIKSQSFSGLKAKFCLSSLLK